MSQYQCSACFFIYDEAEGLPEEGIEPGTPWETLSEEWVCPDCGGGKMAFTSHES